jgi:hypothetical protein
MLTIIYKGTKLYTTEKLILEYTELFDSDIHEYKNNCVTINDYNFSTDNLKKVLIFLENYDKYLDKKSITDQDESKILLESLDSNIVNILDYYDISVTFNIMPLYYIIFTQPNSLLNEFKNTYNEEKHQFLWFELFIMSLSFQDTNTVKFLKDYYFTELEFEINIKSFWNSLTEYGDNDIIKSFNKDNFPIFITDQLE